ncbi:MAG: YdcF family protein [Deltaproteobacteria bacterium]
MDYVYMIFKGFVDPVLIVILLLLVAFFICLIGSKKKSGVLVLFLSIVLLYGASIFPVANYLCYYLEKDYINNQSDTRQNLDVVVVLGGGAHDINSLNKTFPNEVTIARLLSAIDVYNKNGAKYFVCMGKGSGKIAEGDLMAQLAQKLGVPKEKIIAEGKSINTWASAVELHRMFANKNISIGLVTSAWHLKRAQKEFKKYFDDVVPFPANYYYTSSAENIFVKYAPQTDALFKTSQALREIVGKLWYSVKSLTQ